MDLSKDEVFTLINTYRNQRVLWDTNQRGYFNKNIKAKAWQIVADAVGVDLENAKRKMASLLGSFRREKSRGKRINNDDPTSPVQYKSDWFAFKAFSFLLDPALNPVKFDSRPPDHEISNNFDNEDDENGTISTIASHYEHNYLVPDTVVPDVSQDTTIASFPKPIPILPIITPRMKRSMSGNHDNSESPAKRDCPEPHTINESVRKDATAKFAKYLEAKLNLFNPTASAILIHKINQLIFEAEMSSISQPHSFSMASGSPKSNWTPSPPHVNPLVQIEVSRYDEDDEDKKDGIINIP
ncbi:uncharacterized protein LOC125229433 isoform X1 [Leguminivora glycinivorella]|uniref:uncharacterized protein LOC125229433 isoform X1 n=1 Tax=Leguminivora glycinivorella TaxID=1035111 RepID=UPI00200E49E2|nr:uncharacterized protein LOC125229433 isoform X1 [Leguminivora glycinivorella]